MDFGPNEGNIHKTVDEGTLDVAEGGIETKKEKTRRKMIAENRAILSLMEQPNEDGKCWLEQPDSCIFTCFLCSSVVATFPNIYNHMENAHPLDSAMCEVGTEESPVATIQCIGCPKRFKKKNHLKVMLHFSFYELFMMEIINMN